MSGITARDIERALESERVRKNHLADALYAAARDLWFSAQLVASGPNGESLSLGRQRRAWDAERVARGLPAFMGMDHSDIRPAYAEHLPDEPAADAASGPAPEPD